MKPERSGEIPCGKNKSTVHLCPFPLPPWSRLTPPDDETKERYALFYNVIIVDTGIADLPAAVRRSFPPWSRLTPPDDGAEYRYARSAAGRGRPALPRLCYARQEFVVHRQNTCGRTRASAPTCSTESKYGHRWLASGGSPPDEERPYLFY